MLRGCVAQPRFARALQATESGWSCKKSSMPAISSDDCFDKPNWIIPRNAVSAQGQKHKSELYPWRSVEYYLGVDVAEAGDHVVAVVAGGGGGHAGLLAAARGREHDGVGVVPGAHGEVPGGEEGGGLRAVAGAIAGAVAAAAGDDALPDVGDEAAHLRYLRQVLPREAPLRAQPPVRHRAGIAAAAGVAAHPSRRGHAIACNSSQAARQFLQQILLSVSGHN